MTDTTRRALIAAALGLPTRRNATPAAAQPGPGVEGTLRLLVPAAPGGGWDGTAQVIAQVLQETGAVPAVRFEYRPGAGGGLGLPRPFVRLGGEGGVFVGGGPTQGRLALF